jgi:hypothetical protein
MPTRETEKRKEGLIARHLRTAQEISREPRSVVPRARAWLATLWAAKGGGFYGLGYVIAFLVLEAGSLTSSVGNSSVSGFVTAQAIQYVLRFSVESILNTVLALVWPIHLLTWLGGYGLIVLAAGYAIFELGVRPLVEVAFPELKEARIERARLRQEKRDRKRHGRAKP